MADPRSSARFTQQPCSCALLEVRTMHSADLRWQIMLARFVQCSLVSSIYLLCSMSDFMLTHERRGVNAFDSGDVLQRR